MYTRLKALFFQIVAHANILIFGFSEDDERNCITLAEAIELYEQGAVFIDVRRPGEWRRGSVKRALHATAGRLDHVSPLPDKSSKVITYCEAGDRARRAADSLRALGFTNVYFIWPGGFSSWENAGYPVIHAQ